MKPERIETKELASALKLAAVLLAENGQLLAADDLDRAAAHLLELEKDRERLDWLEKAYVRPEFLLTLCSEPRQAIDSAMEESK